MEFFIGTIVTLFGLYFFRKGITPIINKPSVKIRYNQSMVNELTKGMIKIDTPMFPKMKNTQSYAYEKKNTTRIIYLDNQAWGIESGLLTVANIDEEGQIDYNSKKGVDTYTMDKIQLDKTIFIVEKLTEGL
jgi:hypothetical protein